MGNHRKSCSQGSIPFSWEDSPGVSKSIHPTPPPLSPRRRSISVPTFTVDDSARNKEKKMKMNSDNHNRSLPPPPPSSSTKLQRGSLSGKTATFGRCGVEDPFLAAYKECTKDRFRWWKLTNPNKTIFNCGLLGSRNKLVFSCKNACDVEEGSLVARLANLPLFHDDNTLPKR